ncbi:hypothetical protein L5515_009132 [Caenorhabditis briggsae]|uniref:Uncharacterized protein n=1 Tax=Caenorhabditis briggsae TaxID=6238 RepID=A0AAE9F909_CAEBR|nr:hypothetical protein L5515_009132 [Caenorhabditis briggsae]
MFKIIIALSVLTIAVFAAQFRYYIKSDLLSAGISEPSIDRISIIEKNFYTDNKPALGQQMDHETMATPFKQFMEKVGEFMQTQFSEDQKTLRKCFEEKKADIEARMAAAN